MDSPIGMTFLQPLFVDAKEAVLVIARDALPPGANRSPTGVVRLRLDSLPSRSVE